MSSWDFSGVKISSQDKTELIARMVQIMVLVMTGSTCYKFGGRIFRQRSGLGIGLRGSAALARLVMIKWDRIWGKLQKS